MIDSAAGLETSVDVDAVTVVEAETSRPRWRSLIQHLPITAIVAGYVWGVYDQEGKRLSFADEIEHVFISVSLEGHQKDWDKVKAGFTLVVQGRYSALYVRNDLVRAP
jgi:hypothetical protein